MKKIIQYLTILVILLVVNPSFGQIPQAQATQKVAKFQVTVQTLLSKGYTITGNVIKGFGTNVSTESYYVAGDTVYFYEDSSYYWPVVQATQQPPTQVIVVYQQLPPQPQIIVLGGNGQGGNCGSNSVYDSYNHYRWGNSHHGNHIGHHNRVRHWN